MAGKINFCAMEISMNRISLNFNHIYCNQRATFKSDKIESVNISLCVLQNFSFLLQGSQTQRNS